MGVFVGILNAISVSALNAFLKHLAPINPNVLTWVRVAAATPVMAMLVTLFSTWAVPDPRFWLLVIVVSIPLEILLAYVGTAAVQRAEMSLVAPLAAFTSIFLIPVGYVILGELPTFIGGLGVLSVVVGSLFLGWKPGERLGHGFMNVLREEGSWLALFGAFIASITISVAKLTYRYAPPLLAAFYITALIAVAIIPLIWRESGASFRLRPRGIAALAGISGISMSLHYVGLSLISAAYFISIKRLSIIFNVIFGRFIFNEDHFRERMTGAILMVAGVVLISLA